MPFTHTLESHHELLKFITAERLTPYLLAIWGKFDPYFIPPGAEAFRRDIPNATVSFLSTGHFALETHLEEITSAMREFLDTSLS